MEYLIKVIAVLEIIKTITLDIIYNGETKTACEFLHSRSYVLGIIRHDKMLKELLWKATINLPRRYFW